MDDTSLSKGILRKPLIVSSPANASSSWLSRIQSRLSTSQQDDDNLELERQFLKRVTFSMDHLTTEHLFYDGSMDDNDKPPTVFSTSTSLDDYAHLPQCYEKACRLREEKEWPFFKDMLQTHCFTPLTTIDLSNQSIGPSFIGPFADTLVIDFGLRTLRLSNCNLDDVGVGTLLNSILMTDRVTELDLSYNSFKAKGFKFISIYILESTSIKTLNISKSSPDRRATQYLSRALLYSTSLQHLNMDQCSLKSSHLEVLAPSVCQSPSLKSLSLRYNRLTSNAAHWLATLVLNEQQHDDMYLQTTGGLSIDGNSNAEGYPNSMSRGLERLDLTGNPLQDASVGPLCQALYTNSTLKYLSLANCKIYPNGCEMLADALYTNQCLLSLDLSENPIIYGSDEGIHALKTALLRNDTLQELRLINTDLDATAAITLAEVLPLNASLTRLDLSENPSISIAGVLALSISVKMNHTLTFLDISIPTNDRELANLQNDIAAVCTNNMIRHIEQQQKPADEQEEQQQQDQDCPEDNKQLDLKIVTSSSSTLSSSSTPSSSSSSSSITSSSSHISIKENNDQSDEFSNQQKPASIKIPSNTNGSSSQYHSSSTPSTITGLSDQISPLDEISLADDM